MSSNKCSCCSVQQCDFEQVKLVVLLEKCVTDLISPSLLANILKHLKKCHECFHLGTGERTESSDKSSAETKVPKSKPLKKLKLSVPKDKGQFVDNATEATFSKQFVPKNTATSTKWAVLNFVTGRDGETLKIKSMTHF